MGVIGSKYVFALCVSSEFTCLCVLDKTSKKKMYMRNPLAYFRTHTAMEIEQRSKKD